VSRRARRSKNQRAKASADVRRAGQTPPTHETSTETPPPQGERPDLSGITNPWEYLDRVRQIPVPDRGGYTNKFLNLCSAFPPIESDAMVKAGAEVFHYRAAVAYETVRKFHEATELQPTSAATVVAKDEGWMAEMVYDPGREDQPLGYLVHRFDQPDAQPKFETSVTYRTRCYTPGPGPQTLIDEQFLLVPSGIEEYETTSTLIKEIQAHVERYLFLPDAAFRDMATAYALMTWISDGLGALPYLRALGDWGTAKSRFLEIFGSLCRLALFASGAITAAAIFRLLDRYHPTLILDEMDFAKQEEDWALIYKVLNVGYTRRLGGVFRCEAKGEGFTTQVFNVFGAKLLATRQPFPDPALESRCLTYRAPMLTNREIPAHIPLTLPPEAEAAAGRLRNKLLLWRFRNWGTIVVDPRARMPEVEEPRVQQIIAPLLACVPDDKPLRAILLKKAQELGADIRETRQIGLEAEVLEALEQLKESARTAGWWMVAGVKREVERARDPDGVLGLRPTPAWLRVDERRIGSVLKGLGFRRVSHRGQGRRYHYNAEVLDKARTAYGLSPTPAEPEPAEPASDPDAGATDGQPVDPRWDRKPLADLLKGIPISRTGAAGPVIG